jgi:hypothetical protein
MRSRRLLVLAGAAAVAAVVGCLLFVWFLPRVDEAHFARLAVGMHRPEVEAILGAPGWWNDTLCFSTDHTVPDEQRAWPPGTLAVWAGDGLQVQVGFDAEGVVVWKRLYRTRGGASPDWFRWWRGRAPTPTGGTAR